MASRNPFETAERAGRVALTVAGYIVLIFGYGSVAGVLAGYYGWGWWVLLLIPGIIVGWFLFVVIGGLIRLAADWTHDAWLIAKWRWDDRHPEE